MKKCEDCEALSEYIISNQEKFYKIAFFYVHNSQDAMDIVSESILKAYESYGKLRNQNKIKSWFYKILINCCMDFFRSRKWEEPYDNDELPEMVFEEKAYDADTVTMYRLIERLPENMRTVILLKYYEECTFEEIAKITNENVNTTKYRLYAGLDKLKSMFGEEES